METPVPCTARNDLQSGYAATDVADGGGDDGADDDDFRRNYKKLVQENQILHGRVRGYQTLTNVLQETSCKLHNVQQDNKVLQSQLDKFVAAASKHTSQLESERHVSTESEPQQYASAVSQSGQLTQNINHGGEDFEMIQADLPTVEHRRSSVADNVASPEPLSVLSNKTIASDVHTVYQSNTLVNKLTPRPSQIPSKDQMIPQSMDKELPNKVPQHTNDEPSFRQKLLGNYRDVTLSEQASYPIEATVVEQETPGIHTGTSLAQTKQTIASPEKGTHKPGTNGSEDINFIETDIHKKFNLSMKGIPLREPYRQCSEPSHQPEDASTSVTQGTRIKSSSESQIATVSQQKTDMFMPRVSNEGSDIGHMTASSLNRSAHGVEGDSIFDESAINPVLFSKETSFRGLPVHPIEETLYSLQNKEAVTSHKNVIPSGWIPNGPPDQYVSGLTEVMRSEDDNSFMSRFLVVTSELEKMARSEQMRKTLVETLRTENRQLRTKLMTVSNEKETNAMQNRQEVSMLLGKIKRVEHERDAILLRSTSPENDPLTSWVKVDLQTQTENIGSDVFTGENYMQMVSEVKRLQEENYQLLQGLKTPTGDVSLNMRIEQLQRQLALKERQMEQSKTQEKARMKDVDHMLMNMKTEYHKLETEYGECSTRLHEASSKIMSLESVTQELREQNRQLKHDRHKKHTKSPDVAPPVRDQTQIMLEELANDKEALKQQLLIFQEDYQKERRDRARAHSSKEEMRNKIEFLKERLQALEEQKKQSDLNRQTAEIETTRLEQQLRNAEDTVQKTLDENETLYRQVTELQKLVTSHASNAEYKQAPAAAPFVFPQVRKWTGPIAAPLHQQKPAAAQRRNYDLKAPELLPGAWQCSECSFINYPGRNVCEICGFITIDRDVPDHPSPLKQAETPQQNLVARSDYLMSREFSTHAWSDITTDSTSSPSPDNARPS